MRGWHVVFLHGSSFRRRSKLGNRAAAAHGMNARHEHRTVLVIGDGDFMSPNFNVKELL